MRIDYSDYAIADVILGPADFNLNGSIKNVNALMCRSVSSIALPSSMAERMFDAYIRSSIKDMTKQSSILYHAFSQVKDTMCYDCKSI